MAMVDGAKMLKSSAARARIIGAVVLLLLAVY
jgi:hypothetical protein